MGEREKRREYQKKFNQKPSQKLKRKLRRMALNELAKTYHEELISIYRRLAKEMGVRFSFRRC